ncbi:MAG: oxidoreductase [Christensenellales bacterium]
MIEKPYIIAGNLIKNRIVFPAVGTFGYGLPDNKVSEKHLHHYRMLAEGGAGLLIVEACGVSADCLYNRDIIGLWNDSFLPGLMDLANSCNHHGIVSIVQLIFMGSNTYDYKKIKADYVGAAVRCQKAGFYGVELHGAHGYFLNQMISRGEIDFVCDLIRNIKEQTGDKFIIGIRMGCNDPDILTSVKYATAVEECGISFLDITSGTGSPILKPEEFIYNETVYGASCIKKYVNVPIFAGRDITTRQQAESILQSGYSDAVCVGRAILADPQWYNKIMNDIAPNKCLHCAICQWYTNGDNCPARKRAAK